MKATFALVAFLLLLPTVVEAAWVVPYVPRRPVVRPAPPPDQSWREDIPDRPGARAKNKVAVFPFHGDGRYEPTRAAVVRLLRRRGLSVTTNLRPVDTAAGSP
jgi:hypothetical protein